MRLSAHALRFAALLTGTALAFTALGVAPAGAKGDPRNQARQAVAAAQAAANLASKQYSAAWTRYAQLSDQITDLESRIHAGEAEAATLKGAAQRRAVAAYMTRNDSVDDVLDSGDLLDNARRTELLNVVDAHDNDAVSRLGVLNADLSSERDRVALRRDQQQQALVQLKAQQKLLAARLAAAQLAQRNLDARLKRESAAQRASRGRGAPGQIIVNPGGRPWVCPVQGPHAFTNDWGQRRSGGRSHKGTDIMAPMGTPNVAVVSGSMSANSGGLGGTAVVLNGDDGIQYYYAHLRDIVGGARRVSQGELIGHVGNSGNARGGATHTHFEIRRGGQKINPYPTLAAYC